MLLLSVCQGHSRQAKRERILLWVLISFSLKQEMTSHQLTTRSLSSPCRRNRARRAARAERGSEPQLLVNEPGSHHSPVTTCGTARHWASRPACLGVHRLGRERVGSTPCLSGERAQNQNPYPESSPSPASPQVSPEAPPILASPPRPVAWPPLTDSEASVVSLLGSLLCPPNTSGHACAARSLEGLPH